MIFRKLTHEDIPQIVSAFSEIGWNKPTSLYEKYLKEQEESERYIWIAFKENRFVGYVTLKWYSDYLPFRDQSIPEISDLNVLPKFRKKGIGSVLLEKAESEAFKKGSTVGIGVGLSADYGNALKLYIRRGYVPDGKGVTYKFKSVCFGNIVYLDDDLVLWFEKKVR